MIVIPRKPVKTTKEVLMQPPKPRQKSNGMDILSYFSHEGEAPFSIIVKKETRTVKIDKASFDVRIRQDGRLELSHTKRATNKDSERQRALERRANQLEKRKEDVRKIQRDIQKVLERMANAEDGGASITAELPPLYLQRKKMLAKIRDMEDKTSILYAFQDAKVVESMTLEPFVLTFVELSEAAIVWCPWAPRRAMVVVEKEEKDVAIKESIYKVNDEIDCLDPENTWRPATIERINTNQILVHYSKPTIKKRSEWINKAVAPRRIAPRGTKAQNLKSAGVRFSFPEAKVGLSPVPGARPTR
ncbi:hypothetical protein AAMO2058_001375500 [Amorphochlora amoebiformis]|mmetsp:Transcript_35564/g.57391  ORF Transcript_35564/g.57391 Transcript_35564/m.57391 type:complete len:303 (-) Transcript_35564:97-1005(-)